jgi:hypothetical protein
MVIDPLETLATDERRWSITADHLKAGISRTRVTVPAILILGAFLQTLAAQLDRQLVITSTVGFAGVVALAVASVLRQWKLGREFTQAWLLARAASEAFRQEMFLYRAKAGPYAGTDVNGVLFDRRDRILKTVAPAQEFRREPADGYVKVPSSLDADSYITERVRGQIVSYSTKSTRYAKIQGAVGKLEFWLTVAAVLLGVAAAATGNRSHGPWVAVITTVTGALGEHLLHNGMSS